MPSGLHASPPHLRVPMPCTCSSCMTCLCAPHRRGASGSVGVEWQQSHPILVCPCRAVPCVCPPSCVFCPAAEHGQQVVADRQAPARPDGQRRQELLEPAPQEAGADEAAEGVREEDAGRREGEGGQRGGGRGREGNRSGRGCEDGGGGGE